MAVTQCLNIPYNEEKLSIEEQIELEDYCCELQLMLENKIHDMGLSIVSGLGWCVTKFTQEQLEKMERDYENAKKLHAKLVEGSVYNESI